MRRFPLTQMLAGLTVALVVAVAAARGGLVLGAQGEPGAELAPEVRTEFASAWARQPRVDVRIPLDGARVVILKFNDYECPGCREAEMLYRPILQRVTAANPGAVKYVVKDWPWNAACNFNVRATIPGHEASCDAAAAARMAQDRGKVEVMTDWLFAHQGVGPEAVREAAGRLLEVADFARDYALQLPQIRSDIADGGVLGITSTPTYFINGVRVGQLQPALFEYAIALEMSRTP